MKRILFNLLFIFTFFSCDKNPINLEKGNKGQISVNSMPEGAGIILNGEYIDQKTPYVIKNLTEGNYSLKLFHSSYEDTLVKIVLEKDQTQELNISLRNSNILMGYRIRYYKPDSIGLHFQSHFLYNEILLDSIIVIHPSLDKSKFIFCQLISYNGFVDYPYGFNNFVSGKRGEWNFEFYLREVDKPDSTFIKYKCYWVDKEPT